MYVMHLLHTVNLVVCPGLILCQQDAVPGAPLLTGVPPHQTQLVEVLHGTQCTLAGPDVLHKVAKVGLLSMTNMPL